MQFSRSALALVALLSGPVANAFTTPKAAFVSTRIATNSLNIVSTHTPGCGCGSCVSAHQAGCNCLSCGMKTVLFMSSEDTTEADVVPAEVQAMDGVASDEEAHNTDRPARDSGIKKHKKGKNAGTPIADLEINTFVDGTVKTVTSYGAFIDIGASTDALLHVSRISDSFVSNVEDVIKVGDSVSVRVVNVDSDKNQVAVSMLTEEAEKSAATRSSGGGKRKERPQRSQGDKAAQVETMNQLVDAGFDGNQFVEGEVVSTLSFGAFVRFSVGDLAAGVEGELDGLVHISALAASRTNAVEDVVSVGDKVQVRVKDVDTKGNKVSLSMITVEEEAASRPPRRGGDDGPRRRGRAMFSESEMGASDWKESLEALKKDEPTFANMPIIVDKRKEAVSA